MDINKDQFAQVVTEAKKKAAGNARWLKAIDAAAKGLLSGQWIVTELFYCVVITTESGKTYRANGVCQCEAFFRDQPCKHRAAARLLDLYREALAAKPAPCADVATMAAVTITDPKAERAGLIDSIKTRWPRNWPPLYTELLARYGKSELDMLDDDSLRRVSLAISM